MESKNNIIKSDFIIITFIPPWHNPLSFLIKLIFRYKPAIGLARAGWLLIKLLKIGIYKLFYIFTRERKKWA